MFKFTKRSKLNDDLEKEINSVLSKMSKLSPDSKEYTAMVKNLDTLYTAKGKEKDRRISPDTIAVIVANLLGIAIIVGYERGNILTSKALGFIIKGRV